ncbi:hypothetical protein BJ138DRAFT_1167293 [Hygrophoropsis aurantiaca]|uniref:Uncharacterized protein n=1 Tax=Hygrophoropsis aurantiaca TaxID=72124 RepID=A0ACB7ZTG5_9AGAM|nr:hypothetical protein BJ138DRAFT_1167293 [Hygrophoropsis aurantiaca]
MDSNVDMPIPSSFTRYSGSTIIQIASPREDRLDWTRKYTRPMQIFYMQPFNLMEVIVARGMQMTPHLPSERQLRLWYDRYTPSVRLTYQWAARIDEYELSLDRKLRQQSGSVLSLPAPLWGLGAFTFFTTTNTDKLSLELFVVYPTASTADYVCDIPTRRLVRKVIHAVNARTYAEHAKFREVLRIPELSSLGEYLTEELANHVLPLGHTPQQLRKLESDEHAGSNDRQHWAVNPNSEYRPLWFVIGEDPHLMTVTNSPTRPPPFSAHALIPLEYDTDTFAPPPISKGPFLRSSEAAGFESGPTRLGFVYLSRWYSVSPSIRHGRGPAQREDGGARISQRPGTDTHHLRWCGSVWSTTHVCHRAGYRRTL